LSTTRATGGYLMSKSDAAECDIARRDVRQRMAARGQRID
jgi:hypothetical protein